MSKNPEEVPLSPLPSTSPSCSPSPLRSPSRRSLARPAAVVTLNTTLNTTVFRAEHVQVPVFDASVSTILLMTGEIGRRTIGGMSGRVRRLTPNQVVALNLARVRDELGWSQPQAAAALEPFVGVRWSRASYSAVERSVDGVRIKQFSADELVAISRCFDRPISWFLTPPPGVTVTTPDQPRGIDVSVVQRTLRATRSR